ncbi:MAG: DegT/DnrJ/EryC1/StrS family aminotransferase [Chlorobi bacterium]|nr:DegT/DnrJ/EryC1/StrS family aminotransferase [Chlorobiota bacterium]
MKSIRMVDLQSQYLKLKKEIDDAMQEVILSSAFINGPSVKKFAENLADYAGTAHVVPCGNGTDALQVSLMALDLKPGDEVIVPDFTFIATVEVVAFMGLTPVVTDVDPDTFMMRPDEIEKAVTSRTRAIIPVHLYGQCAPMEDILTIAKKHNLFVIEDSAQALGSDYLFSDGTRKKAGTLGHTGCISFFPSKSLGAYGDGGAIFTNDAVLAVKLRSIVNHGTRKKYFHERVGINSRLDTLQAAILDVKLQHLDEFNLARQQAADFYNHAFMSLPYLKIPKQVPWSTHIFHQYTLITRGINRDELIKYLKDKGIPAMIYYPQPMHRQKAFAHFSFAGQDFPVSDMLCKSVLSLPMHPELTEDQLHWITKHISEYPKR